MVRQYVLWTDDFSVFVFAFVFVFVFKYSGIIVNKGKGGELYSKSNQNLLFESFYAENQARFVLLNRSYSSSILNNPTRFNYFNNSRIAWDSIFRYNLAYV